MFNTMTTWALSILVPLYLPVSSKGTLMTFRYQTCFVRKQHPIPNLPSTGEKNTKAQNESNISIISFPLSNSLNNFQVPYMHIAFVRLHCTM